MENHKENHKENHNGILSMLLNPAVHFISLDSKFRPSIFLNSLVSLQLLLPIKALLVIPK